MENGVFKGTRSKNKSEKPHGPLGLEGKVRKEAVIAKGDAQAGRDHVEDEHAPHDPVEVVFKKKNRSRDHPEGGDHKEKGSVNPVNPMEGNS